MEVLADLAWASRPASPVGEPSTPAPAAAPKNLDTATFDAGCFWCSEAVFQRLKGVHSVVSGYCGGDVKNPTYQQVCSGGTGHAEAVQVTFDPSQIGYAELLEVFWKTTIQPRSIAKVRTSARSTAR